MVKAKPPPRPAHGCLSQLLDGSLRKRTTVGYTTCVVCQPAKLYRNDSIRSSGRHGTFAETPEVFQDLVAPLGRVGNLDRDPVGDLLMPSRIHPARQ